MLDSGCCVPPVKGAALIWDKDEVEESDTPGGPPAGLGVEEEEGSRPVDRSGCMSVLTSSSSSSSSSSMLGQADWSSTRFRRSFRALSASCLECKVKKQKSNLLPFQIPDEHKQKLSDTNTIPCALLTSIQQSLSQATDGPLALDVGSTKRTFWYGSPTYCGVTTSLRVR